MFAVGLGCIYIYIYIMYIVYCFSCKVVMFFFSFFKVVYGSFRFVLRLIGIGSTFLFRVGLEFVSGFTRIVFWGCFRVGLVIWSWLGIS